MAYIHKIKENELIGGVDNTDLYPITSTQAIFSQTPAGSVPPGVRHSLLEDRLEDIESDVTTLDATVTSAVDDTYRKDETYSKDQVDQLIETAKNGLFVVVDVLPTASRHTLNKIYLVPREDSESGNIKDEYITVDTRPDYGVYAWEKIGSTDVDLSGYSTTAEMNAAIAAVRQELLLSIYALSQSVYTKQEVYNKAEITEQINNIAQFRPEWAPYGQLPEPNEATMNRLFLVRVGNPKGGNIAEEYITVRVEAPYGPIGSMEGEELQSPDVVYKWEKVGGDANSDAYEIIDLGEQSNYSGSYPDGVYTISYDGNLHDDLNAIWEAHKIPVITVGLTQHTISSAIAMYKNYNGTFNGHEKADNGSYGIDVNVSSLSKIISTRTIGTYNKPINGIAKSDLNQSVQESLNKADTALQEVNWGDITGTLANQTDLKNALDGKQPTGNYVTTDTTQTITAQKTFNTRVNFLGTGDANAIYLSTDTRINVNGTAYTVLGFASGTFLINHANYNLRLRGRGTRPIYNADNNPLALFSDIPTKVSDLTNDAGYLTQHQDISGKADKVENATFGNLASLDSEGNIADSSIAASDISDAVAKKHSHSNKSMLDLIPSSIGTAGQALMVNSAGTGLEFGMATRITFREW